MTRWIWLFMIAGALGFISLTARADSETEQRLVVQQYLKAYTRNDYAAMKQFFPEEDANLFGPYPFIGMPILKRAKVHKNQALVEFSGKTADSQFPETGGILLFCYNNTWRVRQVLFYEQVPAIFNLPKKSVTDTDRKSEPEIAVQTEQFIKAWKQGDTQTMMKHWHRWMDRPGKIKNITVSNYDYQAGKTNWNAPFGKYQARLTYKWGLFSYAMSFNGGFLLVKEKDVWKVCGNVMIMYFD